MVIDMDTLFCRLYIDANIPTATPEVSRKKRTAAQYKGKVWYMLYTKSGKKIDIC